MSTLHLHCNSQCLPYTNCGLQIFNYILYDIPSLCKNPFLHMMYLHWAPKILEGYALLWQA